MSDEEREKLIGDWIALQSAAEESDEYDRLLWASERLWNLAHDQPEDCWETILAVLNRDQSDAVMENLAAGPLEDLLAEHGRVFIERVESRAEEDPQFRTLLGGVWQNEIPDDLWRRITKARGAAW